MLMLTPFTKVFVRFRPWGPFAAIVISVPFNVLGSCGLDEQYLLVLRNLNTIWDATRVTNERWIVLDSRSCSWNDVSFFFIKKCDFHNCHPLGSIRSS